MNDPFALETAAAYAALDPAAGADRNATYKRLSIGKIYACGCESDIDRFNPYIDRVHALRPAPGDAPAVLRRLATERLEWLDEVLAQREVEREERWSKPARRVRRLDPRRSDSGSAT